MNPAPSKSIAWIDCHISPFVLSYGMNSKFSPQWQKSLLITNTVFGSFRYGTNDLHVTTLTLSHSA